jgi:hypothetical protein
MSDTPQTKYFALPQETLQEVLKYFTKNDASAALYEKVSQALPVQQTQTAPAPAQENTPSAN